MTTNRREFLKKSIGIGLAGLLVGCEKFDKENQEPNIAFEVFRQKKVEQKDIGRKDIEQKDIEKESKKEQPKSFENCDRKEPPYTEKELPYNSNEILMAKMLYGEARSCSKEEKIAIAHTVINRINDRKKWNGETLREVILKPYQYSCFNENDVNKKKLKNPDENLFTECLQISREVLLGKYKELNKGQTHYFNSKVVYPSWADKLIKIGKINNSAHDFYIEN